MRITCPSCGCSGDEELFGADLEWRMAMNETLAMPSNCAEGVKQYIRLFRPLKRNLSAARARKLLTEIRELICADEISFDRATYNIPAHIWEQALQIMADKQDLQRPIANHNYLIKVAIGLMARRTDMEQAERHHERRGEARVATAGMKSIAEALDETPLPELPKDAREEWIEKAKRDLIENHGMKPGAFMSDFLIENRARELYSTEVQS